MADPKINCAPPCAPNVATPILPQPCFDCDPPADVTFNTCDGTGTATVDSTVQTVPHPDAVQTVAPCPADITVTAVHCGPTAEPVLVHQIVQTVPHPTARQLVESCPPELLGTARECDGTIEAPLINQVVQSIPHPDYVQRVELCNPAEYDSLFLCDDAGNKVLIVVTYTDAGIPSTVAYNFPALTPYAGDVSLLEKCPDDDLESDQVIGCANGAVVIQWIVKENGQPNGTVYYTDTAGALIPAPAGWTPGPCTGACVRAETIQLCDSTPYDVAAQPTNTDPSPYFTMASSQEAWNSSEAGKIWSGGVGHIPQNAVQGRHTYGAAKLEFPTGCRSDDGTAEITISVRIQNTGPNATEGTWGRLSLNRGATQIAANIFNDAVAVNGVVTKTLTVNAGNGLTLADVLSDNLVVDLNVESNGDTNTPKNFTIDQFSAVATISQAGAGVSFFRTINRDECTGEVINFVDTIDGVTVFVPIEPVAPCCGGDASNALEQDCCQPVQVCIQEDPVRTLEFISNFPRRENNEIDAVWKWTPNTNGLPPNDPGFGPNPAGPWFDTYDIGQEFPNWSVNDPDPLAAWWVGPHPDGSTINSGLGGGNEGPTINAGQYWFARAEFTIPPGIDPNTLLVQSTVFNADQFGRSFRLNAGAKQDIPGNAGTFDGVPPYQFGPAQIPGAVSGQNFLYIAVEETVPAGGAAVKVHFRATYEIADPETRSWTRMVCCDGTVYYLDENGNRQDALPDGWTVIPCASGGSSGGTVTVEEFDRVFTPARPTCFSFADGHVETWHVYEELVIDNTTGTPTTNQVHYARGAVVANVPPAGGTLIECSPQGEIFRTTVRDVTAGNHQILPAGNLVGWTIRNRNSTTGSFSVNGGAVLPLDPGETISSGGIEENNGLLNDTVNIGLGDGVIRITELRRV